jgi:enterochelin esterase-like enzyme
MKMLCTVVLLLASLFCYKSASAQVSGPVWVTTTVVSPGVTREIFNSNAVGAPVSYHIYVPPAYASQPQRRFPVLYSLHGSSATTQGIPAIASSFDAAIAAGKIPPLLVVFPNGLDHGMWCDAESGLQPVESMVIDDLIQEVDSRFRTIATVGARIVEGFSMGGYGAARYAFLYPDRFGAASSMGAGPMQLDFLVNDPNLAPIALRRRILADVYGNSMPIFEARSPWQLAEQFPPAPNFRFRQVVGSLDFTLTANRDFAARLDALNIDHTYLEVDGIGHSRSDLVNALGDEYWKFLGESLPVFANGFE